MLSVAPFSEAAAPAVTRLPSLVTRAKRADANESGDVARLVAAIAIATNIALTVIDVTRFPAARGLLGPSLPPLGFAAIALPLHLRHVVYGLRGERPPAGRWTLLALAIVNVVALVVAGRAWSMQLASLGVSTLIVFPSARGLGIVVGIALLPAMLSLLPLGTWHEPATATLLPADYLAGSVVWRTLTQYVPVRLVAVIEALAAARHALETRAVLQARTRIDAELRNGVGRALEAIVMRGERAAGALATVGDRDETIALGELRRLVADSRHAAADARRTIAGYRTASLRAELDAAAALLEASGARVRVVGADALPDAPDERARGAIRAAVAQALRGEPERAYVMRVERDAGGPWRIAVERDDRAATERTA